MHVCHDAAQLAFVWLALLLLLFSTPRRPLPLYSAPWGPGVGHELLTSLCTAGVVRSRRQLCNVCLRYGASTLLVCWTHRLCLMQPSGLNVAQVHCCAAAVSCKIFDCTRCAQILYNSSLMWLCMLPAQKLSRSRISLHSCSNPLNEAPP
ncbi:hypothetical protein COO60DRAFT_1513984 [Scenedesmus sp. NREL 46B-D3]|nr:hypothetical protein COO60DRAFT_1513984 [Scenedesmus sp. NREL 46B-D3]